MYKKCYRMCNKKKKRSEKSIGVFIRILTFSIYTTGKWRYIYCTCNIHVHFDIFFYYFFCCLICLVSILCIGMVGSDEIEEDCGVVVF